MSRYIDADAIDYRNDKLIDKSAEFLNGVIYMATRIGEAPSIDIVRCKECRHRVVEEQSWGEYNEYCDLWCDGNGYWASVNADDFCSYGERKADD